ncbi:MAG: porin family protein [Candidatus Aminicenantaceae bacterium]
MKRALIITCTVGLLFLCLELDAKENSVRFGLKGSMNITRNWDSQGPSNSGYSTVIENKTTFALGVLASWRLNRRFHLQPEIYYIRKGSRQSITLDAVPINPIKATFNLAYFEIPVLLKGYIKGDQEMLGTHLVAGPYLSFLASDNYTIKNTYLGDFEQEIAGLRSTDYGLIFGLGLDVNGPDARFVFGYRFSLGLAKLELPTGPGLPVQETRNQCHMFVLEVIL